MSQVLNLESKGLFTHPNDLTIPPGSMLVADDVVIDREGMVQPRRGLGPLGVEFSDSTIRVLKFASYNNNVFAMTEKDGDKGFLFRLNGTTSWDAVGNPATQYLPPDSGQTRTRFQEAGESVFWTTSTGVFKLDSQTGSPVRAGGLKAVGGTYDLDGQLGFLSADTACAYRMTVCSRDANNVLIEGAPSPSMLVTNPYQPIGVDAMSRSGTTVTVDFQEDHNFTAGTEVTLSAPAAIPSFVAPIGTMNRVGTVVTVVLGFNHGMRTGQQATMSPGEANFAAGTYTVTVLSPSSFLYTQGAVTASNTVAQTWQPLEAFPGGIKTIATVPNSRQLTYTEAGAQTTNTQARTMIYPSTNVVLNFPLPEEMVLDVHFLRFYRTRLTGSANGLPDENYYQVYEAFPVQAQLDAGEFSFTDRDTIGDGEALYTNTNISNGIEESNEPPPLARDLTVFKDCMFYANTTSLQRVDLQFLTGNFSGGDYENNIYIVSNGVTYTFIAGQQEVDPVGTVATFDASGQGTASQAIAEAAQSFARMVNKMPDLNVLCFYTSTFDERPGQLTLESTRLGDPSFTIYTNTNPSIFNPPLPTSAVFVAGQLVRSGGVVTASLPIIGPDLPAFSFSVGDTITMAPTGTADPNFPAADVVITSITSGYILTYNQAGPDATSVQEYWAYSRSVDAVESSADREENAIYFSKPQQYEAVPLVYVIYVGDASNEIKRILPLRESLIILKTDGIWRLTGNDPQSFGITPLDLTTKIIATETAATMSNRVRVLCDQGVVDVTETGVQILSRPIEQSLLEIEEAVTFANIESNAFAFPYETDRKYLLFLPETSADTYCKQAFVYNDVTQTWTRWVVDARTGFIRPDTNLILIGDGGSNLVRQERKIYNYTDYADLELTLEVASGTGTEVTFVDATGLSAGDVVQRDSDSVWATVLTVDGNTVTTDKSIDWVAADAVTAYKAIPSLVQWAPFHGGQPGTLKQFREMSLFFRRGTFAVSELGFHTELAAGTDYTEYYGSGEGSWGQAAWGSSAWGGDNTRQICRIFVPKEKQKACLLYVTARNTTAWAYWELQGGALSVEGLSERTRK